MCDIENALRSQTSASRWPFFLLGHHIIVVSYNANHIVPLPLLVSLSFPVFVVTGCVACLKTHTVFPVFQLI